MYAALVELEPVDKGVRVALEDGVVPEEVEPGRKLDEELLRVAVLSVVPGLVEYDELPVETGPVRVEDLVLELGGDGDGELEGDVLLLEPAVVVMVRVRVVLLVAVVTSEVTGVEEELPVETGAVSVDEKITTEELLELGVVEGVAVDDDGLPDGV